jgi:hypothetical protein
MGIRRGWIIAGLVPILIAGVAATSIWRLRSVQQPRPGDTISLRDGHLTFRMPQGWQRVACFDDSSNCVFLGPPHGASKAISIIVVTPFPREPAGTWGPAVPDYSLDLARSPGGRSFTVDGAAFARAHLDGESTPMSLTPATVVTGHLPDGDVVFLVCEETAEPALVRAGCEVVIGSLHVQR